MVVFTDLFDKLFKRTLKPWPRSRQQVRDFIKNTLSANPPLGDKYPGFGPSMDVRKIRIGLDHYNIGKSNGLRLLCLYLPQKKPHCAAVYLQKSLYQDRAAGQVGNRQDAENHSIGTVRKKENG
jgi:hypothetical protein